MSDKALHKDMAVSSYQPFAITFSDPLSPLPSVQHLCPPTVLFPLNIFCIAARQIVRFLTGHLYFGINETEMSSNVHEEIDFHAFSKSLISTG